MNRTTLIFAIAAGLAIASGQALAQNVNTPGNSDPSGACGAASAGEGDSAPINPTAGAGGDAHNLKVFSCNGVRVGTVVSTTSGPGGTVLTVTPDANFLNGVASFQVSAKGAKSGEGEIDLALTDGALRASLADGTATR